MPIKLRTPGVGGHSTALPSYFYRSKEEQASRLLDFVKDVESASYVYYTEDLEYGRKIINEHKSLASVLRLESCATPYMKQLMQTASAALTMGELDEALWSVVYPVPGATSARSENSLLIVPVGQPEQTLRGFAGKCNKKPTQDLYGTLSDGLPPVVIEELEDKVKNYWEGDSITLRYEQYAWEGVVDEALFAKQLEEKIGKTALKDLAAANFLSSEGRSAIVDMVKETSPAATAKYLTALFGKTVVVSRLDSQVVVDGVSL